MLYQDLQDIGKQTGRSTTTYEKRMEMELYYVDNCSLTMDIKIFFKTIVSVLKKEGAV